MSQQFANSSQDSTELTGFICPAEFWAALGYTGDARWVAIWWEAGGDEACYSDGHMTLCGANFQAYLHLVGNNFDYPEPDVWGYEFGSSETIATHWIVIDRTLEIAYAMKIKFAENFLRQQHAPTTSAETVEDLPPFLERITWEDMSALIDEIQAAPAPSHTDVMKALAAEGRAYNEFVSALATAQEMAAADAANEA